MSLPPLLPKRGLDEILGAFSSGGQALAALDSLIDERDWQPGMVTARLNRLLLADLVVGPIDPWPRLTAEWLESLPATSYTERAMGLRARAVDWRATARIGWPPESLITRPRRRENDQLLLTALRWTLETLDVAVTSAKRVWADVDTPVRDQLTAALALLDLLPVAEAQAVAPDATELAHIAGEGHPWNLMAPVTGALLRHQALSPADLAQQIQPNDHWRLFHLAVLGEIVCAAREAGREVRSTGPVAAGRACYAIDDLRLWIEGGGYDHPDRPYRRLSKAARGSSSPLTPDIVVLNTTTGAALLIEVKWYSDGTRALRDGARAALAYALDAHPAVLDVVTSVAVLPDHQVIDDEKVKTAAGEVGVAGVRHVADLVAALS